MNSTPELPLLRNCALSWPVAVGVAAGWGSQHALAAGICGGLVIGNLWLLSVLGSKLVEAIAKEDSSAALWMAALLAKFLLFAGLLALAGRTLPPLGLALGFVPLLLGTLLTGIELAVRQPADFETTGGGPAGAAPTDEA